MSWVTKGRLTALLIGALVAGVLAYGREQRRAGAEGVRADRADSVATATRIQNAAILQSNALLAKVNDSLERRSDSLVKAGERAADNARALRRELNERALPATATASDSAREYQHRLSLARQESDKWHLAYLDEQKGHRTTKQKEINLQADVDRLTAQLAKSDSAIRDLQLARRPAGPSVFQKTRIATQWAAVGALACLFFCPTR